MQQWVYFVLFFCAVTALLSGCTLQSKALPDSFTIKISADRTSSGGDRYLNATFIFVGNEITSGWQKYESWSGDGEHTLCEYDLDTKSLMWNKKQTIGTCVPEELPLTKSILARKIGSGEIKPLAQCKHYTLCYEILQTD